MAMAFRTGPALECGRFSSSETAVCASSSFSLVGGLVPQIHKPEDYVSALEEERRKVEGFQRELPLCMRLLQDAIQIHKEKLTISTGSTLIFPRTVGRLTTSCTDSKRQSRSDRVMEEFKPLRRTPGYLHAEDEPGQSKPCKHSWTEGCSAEAKSDNTMNCQTNIMIEQASLPRMCQQMSSMTPKPHFYSSNYSGGAFMPFSKENQVIRPTPRHGTLDPKDLLNTRDSSAVFCQAVKASALVPKVVKENGQQQPKEAATKAAASELKAGVNNKSTARKGRRCWSPHLHRSFVNALQQLGGSDAATPKQIREVMRVDGLTNEEIKSHLQKYRLHARRLGTKQSSCVQPPHVVVLSETWVPSGYALHLAGKQASSSVLRDNCLELESSIDDEVHLHDPSCCEAHWGSLQGHLQFWENQPAMAYQPLQDNGREESMEDNGGVGASSCGSGQPKYELRGDEVDDAGSRDVVVMRTSHVA